MSDNLKILDNFENYHLIDPSGMSQLIKSFPQMMVDANNIVKNISFSKLPDIENILFCGMGGSAISADIASVLLSKISTVPYFVVRGYNLPNYISNKSLVIVLSYSGNTEETLSCYEQAIAKTSNIVVISSGGKLLELAKENNNIFIQIPKGLPPRASMPYLLVPIIYILSNFYPNINYNSQIKEAIDILLQVKSEIDVEILSEKNYAKQIAYKLNGRFVYIFGAEGGSDVAAYRWKCQFSENSKINSFNNSFPELNHNEIVNLTHKVDNNIAVIFLRDSKESDKMKKRIEVTKNLLSQKSIELLEVFSKGESDLARLLSLSYFGDYVSLYLAILSNVDPMPVKAIDELKKQLG